MADAVTDALRRRASDEGFDEVAVAEADALERDGAALETWLAAGRHATMAWMATRPGRRADPRELLPGCRSVVVVALNYWRPSTDDDGRGRIGRVARYARARDYHRTMGGRLRRLARWLEEATGEPSRGFVDSAPILERAWAERSGIGWIGKNANLLTRRRGSWLLLGEILTAAALEADRGPAADHCGSCTACIDACPTDAIVADGVVDARRCISYWTIEHRGDVPERERAWVDDWIFGCDVCQDVCPWNTRFAEACDAATVEPRDDLDGLDPLEILDLDEASFRARYSGTPLMRARWDGMRRNAALVLGNRGTREHLSRLERHRDDPDGSVRAAVRWAADRIRDRPG